MGWQPKNNFVPADTQTSVSYTSFLFIVRISFFFVLLQVKLISGKLCIKLNIKI